jgi:GntR family transcriptional regulator
MEFDDRQPIYLQIIEDFKQKLVNGTYKAGQEIPSRRELAHKLGVNPNTVQRAYREMEEMKLIKTLRGQGSIMTDDAAVIRQVEAEMIHSVVSDFLETMRAFGKTDGEIFTLVQEYISKEAANDYDSSSGKNVR